MRDNDMEQRAPPPSPGKNRRIGRECAKRETIDSHMCFVWVRQKNFGSDQKERACCRRVPGSVGSLQRQEHDAKRQEHSTEGMGEEGRETEKRHTFAALLEI